MTATDILAAAGWFPHPEWGEYERGTRIAGITPDRMTLHIKDWAKIPPGHPLYSADTPDTPEEAAAWLVALYEKNKAASDAAADEADSFMSSWELGYETDGRVGAQAGATDSVGEGVSGEQRGELVAGGGGDQQPIDAEFTQDALAEFAQLESPPEPALEGGDLLAIGEDIKDFAPEEIEREPDVSQFIFGDNLALDRLVRQGQVADKAAVLIQDTRVRSKFSPDEFSALQNYVVRNLDEAGSFVGDPEKYTRFVELSDAQAAMRTIENLRDGKIDYIRTANRQEVALFDPNADWPEF